MSAGISPQKAVTHLEGELSRVPRLLSFGDGWSAVVFTSWDIPGRVVQVWNSMARDYGDHGVFLTKRWLELWASTIGRSDRLFVTVVEHRGEIQGIFPCGMDSTQRVRALAFDLPYDFLISPIAPARTVDCLLKTVRAYTGAGAYFHDVPSFSAAAPVLVDRLRRAHAPLGVYAKPAAPYVDLKSLSWPAYLHGLHPQLVNNLRKGRRRAAREGELFFQILQRPPSLSHLLDEVFDVESRGWKGQQGTAIKCDPDSERFYRGMAEQAMDEGRLYVFVLRLNDKIIAFDLCIANGGTMFAVKTGYDQDAAARLSPGNLMRRELLEYLFREPGFSRYNFLGPAYPWKLQWTSATETWSSFELYPSTIPGWYAYFRKYGWKKPVKRSMALLDKVRSNPLRASGGR